MAFRDRLTRLYTVCNVYISPGEHLTSQDLVHLVAQLPEPIIFCGDFNAKHEIWGITAVDAGGVTVERFLLQSPLTVIYTNAPTHLHSATGSSSVIDFTLCLLISLLNLQGKSVTTFMTTTTGRLLSGMYTLQQPHVNHGTCCTRQTGNFLKASREWRLTTSNWRPCPLITLLYNTIGILHKLQTLVES